MKLKTKIKLERRWLNLPVHHIDTSVIFGAFLENEEFKEECKNYLNKVGYKYRGQFSVSVIGETFMLLSRIFKEEVDCEIFFKFFSRLVAKGNINFAGANFEVYDKVQEIHNADYSLEPLDSLHLATAINSGAHVFVTLDQKLLENKHLESIAGISIEHPENL